MRSEARFSARVVRCRLEGLGSSDPWDGLFQIACAELSGLYRDIVPSWVFDPEGDFAIDRHVPTIPLSQDEHQHEDLGC